MTDRQRNTTPFFIVWLLGMAFGIIACFVAGRLDVAIAIYIPMILLGGVICGKHGTERYAG